MASESRSPLAVRILLKFIVNVAVVWGLTNYVPQIFELTGDIVALIVVGALITLMNMIVRPILALITMPLKLFATILAIIVVNGIFVQLIVLIIERMDPTIVSLSIGGGLLGWVVVAIAFGFANWLMKASLK